jgi:two-component system chemotaxis response regulator CheY
MSNRPWVGKSVLIIDDSEGVREDLTRVFTAVGLNVKGTAANGVIGLEMLRKLQPDVVSIDIIMPEMDGIECYRKIQQIAPETVCIMISWLAGEPKILENLTAVIPTHLFQVKPVTPNDLEARLKKIYFPDHQDKAASRPGDSKAEDSVFGSLGVKLS